MCTWVGRATLHCQIQPEYPSRDSACTVVLPYQELHILKSARIHVSARVHAQDKQQHIKKMVSNYINICKAVFRLQDSSIRVSTGGYQVLAIPGSRARRDRLQPAGEGGPTQHRLRDRHDEGVSGRCHRARLLSQTCRLQEDGSRPLRRCSVTPT